jgi:hypothetical protein
MEFFLNIIKKIMISKGGLNVIGFAWYFMFVQNNIPSLHHMKILCYMNHFVQQIRP